MSAARGPSITTTGPSGNVESEFVSTDLDTGVSGSALVSHRQGMGMIGHGVGMISRAAIRFKW